MHYRVNLPQKSRQRPACVADTVIDGDGPLAYVASDLPGGPPRRPFGAPPRHP